MINQSQIEVEMDRANNYPLIRGRKKSYFEGSKSQKLRNNTFIKRCMNLAINAAKKLSLRFKYVELIEIDAEDQQPEDHFKFVVKHQQNQLININKNYRDLKILKAKELSYMSNEYYCVFREASQINDLPSLRRIKFLQGKINQHFQLKSNTLGYFILLNA